MQGKSGIHEEGRGGVGVKRLGDIDAPFRILGKEGKNLLPFSCLAIPDHHC